MLDTAVLPAEDNDPSLSSPKPLGELVTLFGFHSLTWIISSGRSLDMHRALFRSAWVTWSEQGRHV